MPFQVSLLPDFDNSQKVENGESLIRAPEDEIQSDSTFSRSHLRHRPRSRSCRYLVTG